MLGGMGLSHWYLLLWVMFNACTLRQHWSVVDMGIG
jgi:hypothetical protein